jgi:hypothetical protein
VAIATPDLGRRGVDLRDFLFVPAVKSEVKGAVISAGASLGKVGTSELSLN